MSESPSSSARSGAPASATAAARFSASIRRAGQPFEQPAEHRDLVPVDLVLDLERSDGRLAHVRPGRQPEGQRSKECGRPASTSPDRGGRVLFVQRTTSHVDTRVSRRDSCSNIRAISPCNLGVVSQHLAQEPPQPDGFGGEIAVLGEALSEVR